MTVIHMRGTREPPKAARSKMETKILTPDVVATWRIPAFQRALKVNAKVLAIAEKMKEPDGEYISGVLHLGTVGEDRSTYWVFDGQHRIEAAKISGVPEFIANVRIQHFDTMKEMGVEFVELNSHIVRMRPDDFLKGMEGDLPALKMVRKDCPYVAYDNVRRGGNSPVLSMAATIRAWVTSAADTPSTTSAGGSALQIAMAMTPADAVELIAFLKVARTAWGDEPQNFRLWGNLNLTLCMWLWRLVVKQEGRTTYMRAVVLNADQFKRCLMSVASESDYSDWLVGRNVSERDRSPAYNRLKTIFVQRLRADGVLNTKLPQPSWATARAGG